MDVYYGKSMPESSRETDVVIFGGAGYIGSVLTRKLLEANYSVRVVDNFLFGDGGLRKLSHPNLETVNADICSIQEVSAAAGGAETVILLAAIVGRRVSELALSNMRDVNLLASSVVLDAAIEHGASRVIFASSDSVYGIQNGVMYETGTPEPVSLYSRLKLRMEERVIGSKRGSFHPTALRIATCHGYSPRMRFDLLANTMIRDAVCQRRVVIHGGDQYRALVHVEDVARAFVSVIESHSGLVSGEVFNVGSNEQNVQIIQVANLVKSLVPEAEMDIIEEDPDLSDYHLSCSKIQKVLNFAPRWSLESSLAEVRDMLVLEKFGDPYSFIYRNT